MIKIEMNKNEAYAQSQKEALNFFLKEALSVLRCPKKFTLIPKPTLFLYHMVATSNL